MICYSYCIFLQDVNASPENSLVDSLSNMMNNTLGITTGGISGLLGHLEYTIDIDPKEVFPNQTIKERILNESESTSYFIPTLDYNLLGFNISAVNIQIQTDTTKTEENKTKIQFPIMIAENVRVDGGGSGFIDMSFDSVDLSSVYVIYDQETNKFTAHVPIMIAAKFLFQ